VKIGGSGLGFSLDAFGFTVSFQSGPKQNVLIENDGISGNVNFYSGRDELVDTAVAYKGGSYNCTGMIALYGLQLTNAGRFPLIQALESGSPSNYSIALRDCQVDAPNGSTPELTTSFGKGSDHTQVLFDGCLFRDFSSVFRENTTSLKLRDCRMRQGSSPLKDLP